jgi:hypothetical protein
VLIISADTEILDPARSVGEHATALKLATVLLGSATARPASVRRIATQMSTAGPQSG